jgi:hypothetical protein
MEPPQDFVKINRLAIKMNAISRSVKIFLNLNNIYFLKLNFFRTTKTIETQLT